jgi:hypothetical protein
MKKYFIISTIGMFMLVTICSCKKAKAGDGSNPLPASSFPAAVGSPINIVLHPELPGLKIEPGFEGLSYEISGMTGSQYFNVNNTSFINLLKNLGDGYLRIGGSTSDRIVYTGKARQPSTPVDSLTTTDIDALAAFAKVVNWKVIFGLNLGDYNPALATREAQYVSNALGDKLYTFQFGNEPDLFNRDKRPSSYAYSDYQNEWDNYQTAIKAVMPNAPFAGPDVSYNRIYITKFAAAEKNNINLLDAHYYVAGPGSDPTITTNDILKPNTSLPGFLSVLQTAATQNNLKYRLSECNSIYSGGKAGVSDVFASALWALDYMWTVAEYGGQGVNFHSGGSVYSPIRKPNGNFIAQPIYYGMLAFKQAAQGNIIPLDLTNSGNVNCTAHASFNNGIEYLTIINKDIVNAAAITVSPNRAASSVQIMRLTAPSINAIAGDVSFAGNQVNTDGTFQTKTIENYSLSSQSNFTVNVPAGSAAVVKIQ